MFVLRVYRFVIICVTILLLIVGILIRKYSAELPPVETLTEYKPSLITRFYDIHNRVITELYTERRILVPLNAVPVHLRNAVIAVEDDKFYRHWGFNLRGFIRATVTNLLAGRVVQGGSTITQQLAKVIFLTQEKTIGRKIKELLLALRLEMEYSKQEILQMYLNQIYFGTGAYGVEAAARVYFGKPVTTLNLAECALLAGLPRSPGTYSPFKNVSKSRTRRSIALQRMYKLKLISVEEKSKADRVPINVTVVPIPTAVGAYFIEHLRQYLEPKYGTHTLYRGGLQIYTTLDLDKQIVAEQVLEEKLNEYDLNQTSGTVLTENTDEIAVSTTVPPKVQGAIFSLDPNNGQIRVMVGGRDFRESQFNRAVQAKRQPGSAFKPIVYLTALESGFTPVSVIEDVPRIYVYKRGDWTALPSTMSALGIAALQGNSVTQMLPRDPKSLWIPENYQRKHYGPTLLRTALEHSLNICAIRVTEKVKPVQVVNYAHRLGIRNYLQANLSIALGTNETTLIELTNVFATIANSGIRTEPYGIIKVEDSDGNVLEETQPQEEEVVPAATSFVLTWLLRGVVDRGTGQYARTLGRPCAGKTGTTNNYTDAWFIGYVPGLVTGVWVGYDDSRTLGSKMTGGRLACPIWTHTMKAVLKNSPVRNFTVPEGVTFAKIDPRTGTLALPWTAHTYLEAFIQGSEPKEYSLLKKVVTAEPVEGDSEGIEEVPKGKPGKPTLSTAIDSDEGF